MLPPVFRRRALPLPEDAPGPTHLGLALLVARGLLDPAAAAAIEREAEERGEPVPVVLRRRGKLDSRVWIEVLHEHYGFEIVQGRNFPEQPALLERFSVPFLRHNRLLPLTVERGRLRLAVADPVPPEPLKAAEIAAGIPVVPVLAPLEDLEAAHVRCFDRGRHAIERIVADLGADAGEVEEEELARAAEDAPVVRLVQELLSEAVRIQASDLHLEPEPARLRVRYRVHGRLREGASPPRRLAAAVVSRIKILARLDVAERRMPQDGRTRVEIDGREIDLRVATMPTIHGESAVVRLLDHRRGRLSLGELGMAPQIEERFRTLLRAPHGMLLVTGPTGSGKTTTLYAALSELDAGQSKIVSIEDPVEYQLPGVTQIPVRSEIGLDFARILRSVLRQDPDVVMVGETRDVETAKTAVHAALTGHLLLTTLHTNTAAGAAARLLDMGVEPYLLASVLRAVLGQRLVGRLCPECREPYQPDALERSYLAAFGVGVGDGLRLHRARGCRACDGLGHVGRVGIFELLVIDDAMRDAIRARASEQELRELARARGVASLVRDGIGKALSGIVSLDEVRRVSEA